MYLRYMAQANIPATFRHKRPQFNEDVCALKSTLASGIFGYTDDDTGSVFVPKAGYIREIEQMPNFAPPSLERFSELYVQSNLGKTFSSS